MSNIRAEVLLTWGDGEYLFSLKVPEVEELQRITARTIIGLLAGFGLSNAAPHAVAGAGLGAIYQRLIGGQPLASDVREVLRLGLIGGKGIDPIRAKQLVEVYVDNEPVASRNDLKSMAAGLLPPTTGKLSNLCTAIAVVGAAYIGLDELPKAPKGQKKSPLRKPKKTPST